MTTQTLLHLGRKGLNLPALLRRVFLHRAMLRQRRRLIQLDDHLLHDIGLSRDEARREAARRDWNAPDSWFR